MQPERAVRIALNRLYAVRHGRDVPLAELVEEAQLAGVGAEEVEPALRALAGERLAVLTARGWRPAAFPPHVRAQESMARGSWLH